MNRLCALRIFLLLALLLALVGCEVSTPTVTRVPDVTPTSMRSPLGTPQPLTSPVKPRLPTDTPDASRTPVIIASVTVAEDGREVVRISNIGDSVQDLSGFSVYNAELDRRFDFPQGTSLKAGDSVEVHSGPGAEATQQGYFWTSDRIWAQENSDVLLLAPSGRVAYWYVIYGP